MKVIASILHKRVTNFVLALTIVMSTLTAAVMPLLFSQNAGAIGSSETVYDALPSVTPQTNYPSQGFQATSTSQLGDYVHLGGTNRILNDVTVTLSDWAKFSNYSSDPLYSGNSTSWSHPITLNVYSSHLGTNGAPDTLLATKTQSVSIPWRPESDSSCGLTSNGTGWKVGDACFNLSGIASNATFDLSSLNAALPNDVIVGVAYNTNTYGASPIGLPGPYESLNVAVPTNQAVTVGSDKNADRVFLNTSHAAFYTDGGAAGVGIFREDTAWAPYGTVALKITATKIAAPTFLAPANNSYVDGVSLTNSWSPVSGAVSYEYQSYNDDAKTSIRFTQTLAATSKTATNVADASFWWNVRSIDAYGNKSDWSATNKVTVDTTAPGVVTLTAPANNATQNSNDFYFTWDAPTGTQASPLHYEFQSSMNASQTDGALDTNVRKNTESASAEQNYLALPQIHSVGENGTWYWQARAVDAAGNIGPWSTVRTLNIDTSASAAPTNAQWLNSTDGTVLGASTNQNPTTPAWTAPTTGTVDHYEYSFQSPTSSWSAWENVGHVTNLGPQSFFGAGTAGTEGTWQYKVHTINQFGVASAETLSPVINYDRTAPTFDYNNYTTTGNVITPDLSIVGDYANITWTADPANNAGATFDDSRVAPDFSVATTGDYKFTLTATDAAGNSSSFDFLFTYTAPVVTTTEQPVVNPDGGGTPAAPSAFTGVIGAAAASNAGVLGATTTDNTSTDNNSGVKGASTIDNLAAIDTNATNGSIFGLAWYWWILILAGITGLVWGIIAGLRRRGNES